MADFDTHTGLSQPVPFVVECPQCKQPGFVDSWPHIVSSRDTRARDLLLGGKLFKYTCPVCGQQVAMAYQCLYQHIESKTLLLYSPDSSREERLERQLDELLASGGAAVGYQPRLVFTTFEFCEKARLLEEGYDDRIIELMKVGIKRGMLAEGIIGARDILIYERTLEDGSISFIVTGEVPGDTIGVPRGYEYMKREWGEAVDAVTGEYRFGAAWANEFLP